MTRTPVAFQAAIDGGAFAGIMLLMAVPPGQSVTADRADPAGGDRRERRRPTDLASSRAPDPDHCRQWGTPRPPRQARRLAAGPRHSPHCPRPPDRRDAAPFRPPHHRRTRWRLAFVGCRLHRRSPRPRLRRHSPRHPRSSERGYGREDAVTGPRQARPGASGAAGPGVCPDNGRTMVGGCDLRRRRLSRTCPQTARPLSPASPTIREARGRRSS